MIFSSAYFVLFLLIVLSVYFFVPAKMKCGWLLLASYIFCWSYNVYSLVALIYSTFVSYLFGIILDKSHDKQRKKIWNGICLWCGIISCALPFFMSKTETYSIFVLVGTSFYTLQEIGYLIDIYRGNNRAEKNFIKYALFVAFFPKLVSGPIERADKLLKQIADIQVVMFDYDRVKSGFILMMWGYFQKNIIADSFSIYVTNVYEQWESYSGAMLALATMVYAVQLYTDFAGYTNIAVGAAQVIGYELQENFRQPYLACSIKEFWRRWHIGLSTWLRDYIYIPLGGNRKGEICKYINLMITFMVSGWWHGMSWNFVAWGMLHGAYQIAGECRHKIKQKIIVKSMLPEKSAIVLAMQRVSVFVMVNIAWIFFRASGLKSAIGILYKCIFDFSVNNLAKDVFMSLNIGLGEIVIGIVLIVISIVIDMLHEKDIHIRTLLNSKPIVLRWICYMGMLLILTFVEMRRCGIEASNFIYMQF